MDIQINYDYRKEDLEKLPLHELTQFVLAREDKPFNTEVSISFVTDEAIAELNERYRHKEGPTDVLSFECCLLYTSPVRSGRLTRALLVRLPSSFSIISACC